MTGIMTPPTTPYDPSRENDLLIQACEVVCACPALYPQVQSIMIVLTEIEIDSEGRKGEVTSERDIIDRQEEAMIAETEAKFEREVAEREVVERRAEFDTANEALRDLENSSEGTVEDAKLQGARDALREAETGLQDAQAKERQAQAKHEVTQEIVKTRKAQAEAVIQEANTSALESKVKYYDKVTGIVGKALKFLALVALAVGIGYGLEHSDDASCNAWDYAAFQAGEGLNQEDAHTLIPAKVNYLTTDPPPHCGGYSCHFCSYARFDKTGVDGVSPQPFMAVSSPLVYQRANVEANGIVTCPGRNKDGSIKGRNPDVHAWGKDDFIDILGNLTAKRDLSGGQEEVEATDRWDYEPPAGSLRPGFQDAYSAALDEEDPDKQRQMLRALFRQNDFACRNLVNQQLCTASNLQSMCGAQQTEEACYTGGGLPGGTSKHARVGITGVPGLDTTCEWVGNVCEGLSADACVTNPSCVVSGSSCSMQACSGTTDAITSQSCEGKEGQMCTTTDSPANIMECALPPNATETSTAAKWQLRAQCNAIANSTNATNLGFPSTNTGITQEFVNHPVPPHSNPLPISVDRTSFQWNEPNVGMISNADQCLDAGGQWLSSNDSPPDVVTTGWTCVHNGGLAEDHPTVQKDVNNDYKDCVASSTECTNSPESCWLPVIYNPNKHGHSNLQMFGALGPIGDFADKTTELTGGAATAVTTGLTGTFHFLDSVGQTVRIVIIVMICLLLVVCCCKLF